MGRSYVGQTELTANYAANYGWALLSRSLDDADVARDGIVPRSNSGLSSP